MVARIASGLVLALVVVAPAQERESRAGLPDSLRTRIDDDIEIVFDTLAAVTDRENACRRLAVLATPAVNRLVEQWLAAEDYVIRDAEHYVRWTLAAAGPGARPAIATLLDRYDGLPGSTRNSVLHVLADVGAHDSRARVRLAELDQPPEVANWFGVPSGTEWLEWRRLDARLSVDPSTSTADLAEVVRSSNMFEAEFAAELLGRRGRAAAEAVPALLEAVTRIGRDGFGVSIEFPGGSGVAVTRQPVAALVDALVAVAPNDPRIVPVLRSRPRMRLRGPFHLTAADAMRRLGQFGDAATVAIPTMIEIVESGCAEDLILATIEALGALGPLAADAIPALEDVADEEFGDPRWPPAARTALEKIRR